MNLQRLKSHVWQLLYITISIILFSIILVYRSSGILRPLSVQMRLGFGVIIPIAAILIYLSFRLPGRIGDFTTLTLVMSMFALQLNGLWATGSSLSVAIVGLIPSADASHYYHDSLRINLGWHISDFSAMRPFFAGFLSLLIKLTSQNLMASLAALTFIAGLAIYYSAREVQRAHGEEFATFFFMCMFLYYRHHSGTSMSENIGAPLGILAFALFWRGLANASENSIFFGLFMLGFALNARPGPMFILPFALLWLAWIFKKPDQILNWKFLFLGGAAITASFIINFAYIRLLAAPTGTAFSNFSWALYGLASGGKSFNYIALSHPDVFALIEPERSHTIYRMAFELMLQEPGLLIAGLAQRWGAFFSMSWYSAFSFLGGESYRLDRAVKIVMYTLSALGFLKWWKQPHNPYLGLVCLSAIGIILSVPFVPPTDAYRVRLFAAGIAVFGLLPAFGFQWILEWLPSKFLSQPDLQIKPSASVAGFSAAYIILILSSPLIAKASSTPPPALNPTCAEGEDKIAIHFDEGSYVNIRRDKEVFFDWIPDIHYGSYRRSIHNLGGDVFMDYFLSLNPETTILSSVDYLTDTSALITAPTEQLPASPSYIGICGRWQTEPELKNFFSGSQVIVLNPQ